MRYPEGHKREVRERIVREASEALKAHGLGSVSIPALMKRVGLTHGGFYAHFESRDELVAEAISAAAAQTGRDVFDEERSLQEVLGVYLSSGHLDHPEMGCVLAALGTEGARQPPPVRRAFADAARGLLRLVEKKLHPRSPEGHLSDEALLRASMMIGAVVLGRLVHDKGLAERILAVARRPLPSEPS